MTTAGSWTGIGCVVVLVGLLGCGADDAPPEPGGQGGGGAAAPATYDGSACGTCVQEQCAVEITACKSEQECAAYVACLLVCPLGADGNADAACAGACPAPASSAAVTARSQLTACRELGKGATQCAACGVQQGGSPTCPLVNATCPASAETNECYKCEDEKCCETYAAYVADPEAIALKECIVDCIDVSASCEQTCGAQHPEGVAVWAARELCYTHHCLVECSDMPPTPCEECLYGECVDASCDFHGTEEGWLLYACFAACDGDGACEMGCADQHPAAFESGEDYFACAGVLCADSC